jgi:hypothetical protein
MLASRGGCEHLYLYGGPASAFEILSAPSQASTPEREFADPEREFADEA